MNKDFIRILKEKRQLINFIRVIKNENLSFPDKMETFIENATMMDAFYLYFQKYMKEKNLFETFKREMALQVRSLNKYDPYELINCNLYWAESTQGHEFWRAQDVEWRHHLNVLLGE